MGLASPPGIEWKALTVVERLIGLFMFLKVPTEIPTHYFSSAILVRVQGGCSYRYVFSRLFVVQQHPRRGALCRKRKTRLWGGSGYIAFSIVTAAQLAASFPLLEKSALLRRCFLHDTNRRLLALETKRSASIPEHWVMRNVVMPATHAGRWSLCVRHHQLACAIPCQP
jgi:hypothetical protein